MERARRAWQPTATESYGWEPAAPPAQRQKPQALLPAPAPRLLPIPAAQVLVGEREHRWYILEPERVEYIESHGNYVKLHSGNAEYISRNSIKSLAPELTGRGFVRIERSLLVNVRAILYAQRAGRGTFAFTLTSGSCLCSGATFRNEILRVLPLAQSRLPNA
jgi:DNA-binding LytR/AlgR family response regulator